MKRLFAIFAQTNFWLWNLLFAYLAYLGILPIIGWSLLQTIGVGVIPPAFLLSLLLLLIVPGVSIALGIRYIQQPQQLLRIFYGVEVPLLVLVFLRLFALRELPPAGNFLVGTLLLSIATYEVTFLWGFFKRRALATTQAVLHSLVLLMGLYGSAVLLIYVVPAAIALTKGFLSFEWVGWLWDAIVDSFRYRDGSILLFGPLMLIFGWFSAGLFLLSPFALATLYIKAGQNSARHFARHWGKGQAVGWGVGAIATWLLCFGLLNQQPQLATFAQLETIPETPQAKQELLQQSDRIKKGLLNAYLSNYRYISSVKDNNHVVAMYQSVLPNIDKAIPEAIQSIYNGLLSPVIYQSYQSDSAIANRTSNNGKSDVQLAAERYAQFFDQPIQKAEAATIRRALNATAFRDEAKAGLLNINQEKVLIENQDLTIKEHGDWAEVELYERYKNQTNDVQEVYYSFSLPESAVLTGIWLGDTPDLDKRFDFQVSPRGAAQRVYTSQVQRVNPVDPALLEQVGPRHYRLRAFPIPPKVPQWVAEGTALENQPTEMNLWLTYNVMRDDQGWAMPQLGEKRNVFWNYKTKHRLNGQGHWGPKGWLPDHIPASTEAKPQPHQVALDNYQVMAEPLQDKDYQLPEGKRFAIVLDSSRSMAEHRDELAHTFQWLKQQGFSNNKLSDNDGDLFVTAMDEAHPMRLDDLRRFHPKHFTFYGRVKLQEMLTQFAQLQGDTAYDGVIVLTDGDTYELSGASDALPNLDVPLWMVHVGQLPPAYDDGVLKLIQDSDGGVGTDLTEVLTRSATQEALQKRLGNKNVAIADGYAWSVLPASVSAQSEAVQSDETFNALAARQLITQLAKATDADQPTVLDRIHAIAKRHNLVTPYSSMIVLVNDEQRRMLAEAEAAADRFERAVESGDEFLEKPFNPLNSTSVPEASPLLPVVVLGGLFWGVRRQRSRH